MRAWTCDKCSTTLSEFNCHHIYSFSKHKEVDLCSVCLRAHDEALEEADRKFFKKRQEKRGKG